MSDLTMTIDADTNAQAKTITVTVNGKSVIFEKNKVTGAEIKATAIAQEVTIEQDFALFEVKGPGKLKPVGDNDMVTITKNSEFRAVAPDDNSGG